MPAKSNVRKSTSKSGGFKFKWWMAAALVAVVAVVGVVVLRFSHAASLTTLEQLNFSCQPNQGSYPILSLGSTGQCVRDVKYAINGIYSKKFKNDKNTKLVDSNGNASDVFDQNTKDGVAIFQRAFKINADGVIGPQTWLVIVSNCQSTDSTSDQHECR